MNKTILLDGDILVYKMAFSVESPIYVVQNSVYNSRQRAEVWAKQKGLDPVNDVHKRKNKGPFDQVRMNMNAKLKSIYDDLSTSNYRLFLTDSGIENNYRYNMATVLPYKGNRVDMEKPFYYKKTREMLLNDYKAILIKGQEADDQIGIDQYDFWRQSKSFEHSYIASIDKDLRSLEGYHYNLTSRIIDYVDEDTGLKNYYEQLLQGDRTDNIPGLARLLAIQDRKEESDKLVHSHYMKAYREFALDHSPKECYNYVVDKYKSYGYGDKEIDEIGNLLWIRREEGEIWSEKRKLNP